ncbi:hypothetical protein D9M71_764370 [compost metagenome]
MNTKLTVEQAVKITAATGVLCAPFPAFHEAVEKRLGRPVWTHQFPGLADEIKAAFMEDFLAICPVVTA